LRRIRYLGLDLGWTPRDSSGGTVLEPTEDGGVRMVSADSLRSHEDTLRWITRNRGRSTCTLAINAPIIVENLSGARPCDRLLLQHFSRYRIDEYANNTVSASHPRTIGRALMRMGFDPNPAGEGDRIIETHTAAAQVLLFGVDRPVRLKTGAIGARKEGVQRLRELITERLFQDITPVLHRTPELDQLMDAHLPDLNGTRLGELEEKLESLLCAYVAAWLGQVGTDGCAFLGDLDTGYILLPDPSRVEEPA
jgi:predicted RNase H-like nuclease